MRGVKFLQSFDLYNGGELAGFSEERAAELVAMGVAVYCEPELPQPVTQESEVVPEAGSSRKGKK